LAPLAAAYPSLMPAMTISLEIGTLEPVGSASRGTPLTDGPVIGGTLVSDPNYKVKLNTTLVGVGNDYFHADPDGKHIRLNCQGIYQDAKNATEKIFFHYHGVVTVTPGITAVLSGAPNAKSTPFGDIFMEAKFETGVERWQSLEDGIYVGGGHLIVTPGQRPVIQYVMSEVAWPSS